jgi:SH3-like domain-containing protein
MITHETNPVAAAHDAAHFEFQFVAHGVDVECWVDERAFERWRRLGDHDGTMVHFRKFARAIATAHIARHATAPGERWRVRIDEGQATCLKLGG